MVKGALGVDLPLAIEMNGACSSPQALEHESQTILSTQSLVRTRVELKLYHCPFASWLECFIH